MSFVIDPTAALKFAFNWAPWLGQDETITEFTLIPSVGITVSESSQADGVVTFKASGGVRGANATVACHVKTSANQEDQRSIAVSVRDR